MAERLNPKESEQVSWERTIALLHWLMSQVTWIKCFGYGTETKDIELDLSGKSIRAIARFYPIKNRPTSVHLTSPFSYQPEEIGIPLLRKILEAYKDMWIILATGDSPDNPKYIIVDKITNFPIERFGLSSTSTGRNELTLNFGQERWVPLYGEESLFGHTGKKEIEKLMGTIISKDATIAALREEVDKAWADNADLRRQCGEAVTSSNKALAKNATLRTRLAAAEKELAAERERVERAIEWRNENIINYCPECSLEIDIIDWDALEQILQGTDK